MSDGFLLKAVFSVGMIMVLISLIYPGANSSWSSFTNTLQVGPNLPTWQNPMQAVSMWFPTFPQAVGNYSPDGEIGCDASNYYACLQHPGSGFEPENYSFVWVAGTAKSNFSFQMGTGTGYNPQSEVISYSFDLLCKQTPDTGKPVNGATVGMYLSANANFSGVYDWGGFHCLSSWSHQYVNYSGQAVAVLSNFTTTYNVMLFEATGYNLSVAYWSLTLGLSSQANCAGLAWSDFFSCAIGNMGNTIINFFITIGGGIVFFFSFIIAVLAFIVNIIAGVLIGLSVSLLYFFNLPNCPPVIQGILDAIFVVFIFAITLAILDRVIGFTGGMVNKV